MPSYVMVPLPVSLLWADLCHFQTAGVSIAFLFNSVTILSNELTILGNCPWVLILDSIILLALSMVTSALSLQQADDQSHCNHVLY